MVILICIDSKEGVILYSYIKGIITDIETNYVVLENNNIGYFKYNNKTKNVVFILPFICFLKNNSELVV